MSARRLWKRGLGCAVAFLVPLGAIAAEGDQLRATVDTPATVTAAGGTGATDQSGPRVVVHVTGFRPAKDGSVQAVVMAQMPDGKTQEIGRFGIFPQAEFKSDAAGAQRYSFALPKELAAGEPVRLKVDLVPARGTGEGAQLEIGRAEIR